MTRENTVFSFTGKKRNLMILAASLCVLLLIFFFIKSRHSEAYRAGAGNLAGKNMIAQADKQLCFSDPATNVLSVYDGHSAAAVMKTPAWFLTVCHDELYYVSMENGNLKRFTDGENDEIISEHQCYYPQIDDGVLYYVDADDSNIYKMEEENGIFRHPVCVQDELKALFFVCIDHAIYYYDDEETGIYRWDMREKFSKEPLVYTKASCINVTEQGYLYYKDISDQNDPCLVRVTPQGEKKILAHGAFEYVNFYDGYLYYSNTSLGSGGHLFRIAADGKSKPQELNREWSTNITVLNGNVYYAGANGNGRREWKYMKIAEDMNDSKIISLETR